MMELVHSSAAMPESIAPERLTRKTTSIAQMFAKRVHDTPDREAFRYPVGEQWRSMTWRQAGERVKAMAAGLTALGLHREERVGILCNTRLEWLLCDLGILSAGGATTTVYPSSTAEECAFILADSETKYVFAEDTKQLDKLRAHRAEMPELARVILVDGSVATGDADWVLTLADLEAQGAEVLAQDPQGGRRDRRRDPVDPSGDAHLHVRAPPASPRACGSCTSAGRTVATRSRPCGCGVTATCSTCGCRCRTRSARC